MALRRDGAALVVPPFVEAPLEVPPVAVAPLDCAPVAKVAGPRGFDRRPVGLANIGTTQKQQLHDLGRQRLARIGIAGSALTGCICRLIHHAKI